MKSKYNVNLESLFKYIGNIFRGAKNGLDEYEKSYSYDKYFIFQNQIAKLAESLKKLSEIYTVIIIVDELDRCIPEYGIKVLERLHHITESSSNVISVVAVDNGKLVASVGHLFGFDEADSQRYLEKFFNFEVALNYGTISEKITEKYSEYFSNFDKDMLEFEEPIGEVLGAILYGFDIRKQEHIVNRAEIAHKLLFQEKKDYSFMCMELLWTVMICVHEDKSCIVNSSVVGSTPEDMFKNYSTGQSDMPELTRYFREESGKITHGYSFAGEPSLFIASENSLFGMMAYLWYCLHNGTHRYRMSLGNSSFDMMPNCIPELNKFAETVMMIK